MIKLYRSAQNPGQWIAYGPETGWVVFPATENGWELRRPARGLDPMHVREVPLRLAEGTGVPDEQQFCFAGDPPLAKVVLPAQTSIGA